MPDNAPDNALRGLLGAWVQGAGAACSAGQLTLATMPQLPAVNATPVAQRAETAGIVATVTSPEVASRPSGHGAEVAALLGAWVAGAASSAQGPGQAFASAALPAAVSSRLSVPARDHLGRVKTVARRDAVRPPQLRHVAPDALFERRRAELDMRLDEVIASLSEPALPRRFPASLRALDRLKRSLNRPNRLVIGGSINSGKSSLANHLVGTSLVPTNAERNSYIPTLLQFSAEPIATGLTRDGQHTTLRSCDTGPVGDFASICLGIPFDNLKALQILDLPGLEWAEGSSGFQPRDLHGDILVWCTSSACAWSAYERAFWRRQPRWIKERSLLVITHPELLTRTRQTERLLRRVFDEAETEFRDILLMSAIAPSERGSRRLNHWLRQIGREVRTQRLAAIARVATRISNTLQVRLAS